jgi:hypothetical protein
VNKTESAKVEGVMQPEHLRTSSDSATSGSLAALKDVRSGSPDRLTHGSEPGAHIIAASILRFVIGIVSIIAAIIGAINFAFGILLCAKLAWTLGSESIWPTGNNHLHKDALLAIINCAEMFIAAPLPYLVVTAVFQYIRDWSKKDVHDATVQEKLHESKMFLFSLLLSLLTVDLVSRLISATQPPGTLVLYFLGAILVIGAYILFAEFLKKRPKVA